MPHPLPVRVRVSCSAHHVVIRSPPPPSSMNFFNAKVNFTRALHQIDRRSNGRSPMRTNLSYLTPYSLNPLARSSECSSSRQVVHSKFYVDISLSKIEDSLTPTFSDLKAGSSATVLVDQQLLVIQMHIGCSKNQSVLQAQAHFRFSQIRQRQVFLPPSLLTN